MENPEDRRKAVGLLLAVVALAKSAPQRGIGFQQVSSLQPPPFGEDLSPFSAPAQYEFQYEVNEPFHGNAYGHAEAREGGYTQGSYYVQLHDSRLMKVDYTADEFGYHPTITYEGEALHPESHGDIFPQSFIEQGPASPIISPGRVPTSGRLSAPSPVRVPTRVSGLAPIPARSSGLSPIPTRGSGLTPLPIQNSLPDVVSDPFGDRLPGFRFSQPNLIPGPLSTQRRFFQSDFVGDQVPSRFFTLPSNQPIF